MFHGSDIILYLIIEVYPYDRVLSSTAPVRLLYFMCLIIEVFPL